MNFDSNRPANSGDTKLSEIAVDRATPLFQGSGPQQNALITQEVAFRAITELARRQNYILRSEGLITWTGTEIRFDADAQANSPHLEILASEGAVNSHFSLRMQGSISVNGPATFLNLPMADGDLIYLELDSTLLVNNGTTFNLDNAINGGGSTVGMRVLQQPMTVAMPQLFIAATAGGSLFYIPLALRRGDDIFWIPHGIRWPLGTTSGLGAVIVEGIEAYPERFVETQTDLLTALSDLGPQGGGVILVIDDFSIDQAIAVPAGIKIMGRGKTKYTITVLPGGQLTLGNRAIVEDLAFVASAAKTGAVISLPATTKAKIIGCSIDLSATTNVSTNRGVEINGDWNRLYDCEILGTVATNRVGVYYNTGANNADVDTRFA